MYLINFSVFNIFWNNDNSVIPVHEIVDLINIFKKANTVKKYSMQAKNLKYSVKT